MPNISQKGLAMPESPIRKLVPYAELAERRGVHVHYLNIGQPDIQTPEVALDAIKNITREVIEYSHSAGFSSYRNGLSHYYRRKGIELTEQDILVTAGGSEALQIAFLSCFDLGDEVIICEPYYANYNGFAIAAGVTVKPVISKIEDGFALPATEAFEAQITDKTKGIVLCNPANPTGYLYTEEELDRLAAIVKKHDLFVFSDEVYREFTYDGATHQSIMNLEGLEENAVLIDSVSKRYSMCGARVGCMVTKNQTLIQTALKFGQARLSPPTFGQIASEAALETPQSYFDVVIGEYVNRRNIIVEGLQSIEGVKCVTPPGAFYVMIELPVADTDDFCQWMLEHFDHDNQTVMMAPGSGFYSEPNHGKKQVRLAYVLNTEALKASVECLRHGIAQYQNQ